MFTTICFLSCAVSLGQATDRADWQLTPQLSPGLELVYAGSYVEQSLIPNVQHHRQFAIEANVLVLDGGAKDWQAAIMTTLRSQDDGKKHDKKDWPASVRLEMTRIDFHGRLRDGAKKLVAIPIQGPPSVETGFLVPAPLIKVGRNSSWQVAEDGAPAQIWQVAGVESCGGITCIKIVGEQQSNDWAQPRADQSAWRRRDTIWLHPQLNVAQKVERVIERREPARDLPTSRSIVRYELESRLRYPGISFEDRRKEVLKVNGFQGDARPLLQQPGLHRGQIDSLIQRVSFHLDRQPGTQATPYRVAALHLKATLEKAQRGEIAVPIAPEAPLRVSRALDIGERVTDFSLSGLTEDKSTRLQDYKGKPILVFFYNPATSLGQEIIRYIKHLSERDSGRFHIMAMAVSNDADFVRKQHKDMKLAFPILDGNGMRLIFGAEQTPRFVVVDSDAIVRYTQTGWGLHVPIEMEDALGRCLKK